MDTEMKYYIVYWLYKDQYENPKALPIAAHSKEEAEQATLRQLRNASIGYRLELEQVDVSQVTIIGTVERKA